MPAVTNHESHQNLDSKSRRRHETRRETRTGSGGEIQLTDGIRLLLEQQPVYAYMFDGTRYDAGDKLGFLKATVEFALKREDLGTEFRQYLKSLKL